MSKDIGYYMSLPYRIELIADKERGGYAVRFPELRGCITAGDSLEEAVANADDAKRAWVEAMLEDGEEIPEPDVLRRFSGEFRLRIPSELHRSLYMSAREQGISMNMYCTAILSHHEGMVAGHH